MPRCARRRFHFQQMVDDANRIHDSRIVRSSQSEPHQRQRIRTDDIGHGQSSFAGAMIFERHVPRGRLAALRWPGKANRT